MKDPQDPPRLIDGEDGSQRLRDLVRECRNDVASPDDVKQLESSLAPLIWAPIAPPAAPPNAAGPGAATGSAGTASTTAATSGVAVKVAAAVAIAAGVAGGGLWLAKSTSPAGGGRSTTVEQATNPTAATPDNVPPSPPNEPAAPTDDQASAPKSTHDATGRSAPLDRGEAAAESESDLLGRAQAALRTDPSKALALAAEHRRKFPKGVLVQEREVLSIEALERLGRHQEAVARANSFLRSFPGSAHRSKVNAVIGRE